MVGWKNIEKIGKYLVINKYFFSISIKISINIDENETKFNLYESKEK